MDDLSSRGIEKPPGLGQSQKQVTPFQVVHVGGKDPSRWNIPRQVLSWVHGQEAGPEAEVSFNTRHSYLGCKYPKWCLLLLSLNTYLSRNFIMLFMALLDQEFRLKGIACFCFMISEETPALRRN